MDKLELKHQIQQVDNPEVLKQALFAMLKRISALESRLSTLDERGGTEKLASVIADKRDRLERIRHGLTEMNERMQRPYVVSAELQAVKEVLDVLAETGDCNSVILEGEPGTGKTQWAYSEVGQELQEGKDVMLIHVRVKDTMRAQDLLYSIDDVRRLSDAQAKAQIPEKVRQEAAVWKQKIVTGDVNPSKDDAYKAFKERMQAVSELAEAGKDLDYMNYVELGPLGEAIYQSSKGKRVYLIIDEIEKGREELMTGMLDEIENLTFTIAETGTVVKGDKKNLRIVITTNTEDSDKIPSSFRRRSLYHYIDYPNRANMAQIVELSFPEIQKELLQYAISVFYAYHENVEIQKKPSTPELLAWIRAISKDFDGVIPDNVPHKEILLKYKDDQELDIGRIKVEIIESVEKREGEAPHFIRKVLQGKKVYRLTDRLNSARDQDDFAEFYAGLQNEGVNFVTPHFEEREERDSYGDYSTIKECTRDFQVVMPGVESLGNGYYVIPDEKLELLERVLESRVEVLPKGQKFLSVGEKNRNFTKGRLLVAGRECDGYMVEDGRVVVTVPYEI